MREPVKCMSCGVFLSGKNRNINPPKCNQCKGIGFSAKPPPTSGRVYLWKKKK